MVINFLEHPRFETPELLKKAHQEYIDQQNANYAAYFENEHLAQTKKGRSESIEKIRPHEYLKAQRLKFKKTQTQFAEYIGITLRGYQFIESGQREISIQALQRLLKHVDIDLNFMISGNAHLSARLAVNSVKDQKREIRQSLNDAIMWKIDPSVDPRSKRAASKKYETQKIEWLKILPEAKRIEIVEEHYRILNDFSFNVASDWELGEFELHFENELDKAVENWRP